MTVSEAESVLKAHGFTPGVDSTRRHPARDEIKKACDVLTRARVAPPVIVKTEKPAPVKTPRKAPAVKRSRSRKKDA